MLSAALNEVVRSRLTHLLYTLSL